MNEVTLIMDALILTGAVLIVVLVKKWWLS